MSECLEMNLRGFRLCICVCQTLNQFIKKTLEKSILTIIESNSYYIVWFFRQPIHRQDLSTPFVAGSVEGAQLQCYYSVCLQKKRFGVKIFSLTSHIL